MRRLSFVLLLLTFLIVIPSAMAQSDWDEWELWDLIEGERWNRLPTPADFIVGIEEARELEARGDYLGAVTRYEAVIHFDAPSCAVCTSESNDKMRKFAALAYAEMGIAQFKEALDPEYSAFERDKYIEEGMLTCHKGITMMTAQNREPPALCYVVRASGLLIRAKKLPKDEAAPYLKRFDEDMATACARGIKRACVK